MGSMPSFSSSEFRSIFRGIRLAPRRCQRFSCRWKTDSWRRLRASKSRALDHLVPVVCCRVKPELRYLRINCHASRHRPQCRIGDRRNKCRVRYPLTLSFNSQEQSQTKRLRANSETIYRIFNISFPRKCLLSLIFCASTAFFRSNTCSSGTVTTPSCSRAATRSI